MNTVLNNTYITGKKENRVMNVIDETSSDNYYSSSHCRVMRLFVLSSGYVAAFTNSIDVTYWGSSVIPLGFGSEVHAQRAVDIMTQANPENLVVFSGGLAEYTAFTSLDR